MVWDAGCKNASKAYAPCIYIGRSENIAHIFKISSLVPNKMSKNQSGTEELWKILPNNALKSVYTALIRYSLYHWKHDFIMKPHVRLLFGWLVGLS